MISVDDVIGDHYRLTRLLGHGGMSDVFEAVDETTHQSVAVKVVRSSDPELARRFAQEVRALALMDHPGLVRLLDSGHSDTQAFLVMEMVEGTTLAQLLSQGSLSASRTATVGSQLAQGLAYAHLQGIVHRDVKPSNILLDASGDAKLSDFGIARLLDDATMTLAGTTLGTTAYMAPEQLEDHQVGVSADVWSLGVVLMECLAGRRVFEGTPSEVVARRLRGPVPLPGDLPVPWKLILSGMLDHRPDQRLSAAEVAEMLRTEPYHRDWTPVSTAQSADTVPIIPFDLAGLTSAALVSGPLMHDATMIVEPAAPVAGDATQVARPTAPHPPRHRKRWRPSIRDYVFVGALIAVLLFGLLLHSVLGSSPSPSVTTVPPTTSTPTTTAPPGSASALTTLTNDTATAVASGGLDPGVAQSITTPAGQALIDAATTNLSKAATDLQQAANAIAGALQGGQITPATSSTLQSDLAALAAALGVTAPNTSTTAPGNGQGPGDGNGKGHGNH
ncbi:MAG TPA: serine/threonine-protein kinase [Acidimicrobiales bacterium]|nr:serine/threonine-protein kinase [Acidimicrobiales bacterium]